MASTQSRVEQLIWQSGNTHRLLSLHTKRHTEKGKAQPLPACWCVPFIFHASLHFCSEDKPPTNFIQTFSICLHHLKFCPAGQQKEFTQAKTKQYSSFLGAMNIVSDRATSLRDEVCDNSKTKELSKDSFTFHSYLWPLAGPSLFPWSVSSRTDNQHSVALPCQQSGLRTTR